MTEGELLASIEEALKASRAVVGGQGALSRKEIQKALGLSEQKAYELLHKLVVEDMTWECVKIPVMTMTGVAAPKPRYRPKAAGAGG